MMYKIERDRFIVRDRNGKLSLKQAEKQVSEFLEKIDKTSEIKFNEGGEVNSFLEVKSNYSKRYYVNIIQYQWEMSGNKINVGAIVWNKFYNEYRMIFLEDVYIKKLCKIMKLEFMRDGINSFRDMKFQDVYEVRNFINDNFGNNTYPNAFSFEYEFGNIIMMHKDEHSKVDVLDIDYVIKGIYERDIAGIFK